MFLCCVCHLETCLFPSGRAPPFVVKRFLLLAALALITSVIVSPRADAGPAPAPIAGEVQTIAFGSRTVELTLDGTPRDTYWAQRVSDLVIAGGPVLEELIGVPFPGPEQMTISERTSDQLSGYAGMAGCSHVVCGITLLRDFDDTTLLHELTHAWTQSIRNRWLAEGMAEYVSDRAAARIDGRDFPVAEPAGDRPPFPLLDWMLTIDFNSAEEEQINAEYEGYVWSRRFFEQLEATVGPDALRRAMAAVAALQPGTVGVRRFMDAVDDPGGVPADDLFIRYVFPPERESEIRDRRTARDRISALSGRAAAEAPELSQDVFTSIRERMIAWEFAPVITALAHLEEGLNAYLAHPRPVARPAKRCRAGRTSRIRPPSGTRPPHGTSRRSWRRSVTPPRPSKPTPPLSRTSPRPEASGSA